MSSYRKKVGPPIKFHGEMWEQLKHVFQNGSVSTGSSFTFINTLQDNLWLRKLFIVGGASSTALVIVNGEYVIGAQQTGSGTGLNDTGATVPMNVASPLLLDFGMEDESLLVEPSGKLVISCVASGPITFWFKLTKGVNKVS